MTLSLLIFFLNLFLNHLNNYSFFFLCRQTYLRWSTACRSYNSLDFSSENFLLFFSELSGLDVSLFDYVK
jgi:hypothetical protein